MTLQENVIKKYKILNNTYNIEIQYVNHFEKAIKANILLFDWFCYFSIEKDMDIDKEIVKIFKNLIKSNKKTRKCNISMKNKKKMYNCNAR